MNLSQLMEFFFNLFGLRNAVFLVGMPERIDLLSISVSDLQDAIRRGRTPHAHRIALARLVSRVFCVADQFHGKLPLVEALMEKFPPAGCAYCHSLPCACADIRPDHTPYPPDPVQQQWSLRDWCRHIDAVYGERNRQRGFDHMLCRLFREVEELRSISRQVPRMEWSAEKILREHALELADILSWIMSIANNLDVDLEQAVLDRYGDGCTSCATNPCTCTHFLEAQIDWERVVDTSVSSIRASSQQLPRG